MAKLSSPGTIAYYVSGHGLGHASRASQVMSLLPHQWQLIVKSSAPKWFFHHEVSRPFELIKEAQDAPPVQHDNFNIDWNATLSEGERLLAESDTRAEREAQWLVDNHVKVVVCDIPPFPIRAAELAGIPSIVTANFTWVEILRDQAESSKIASSLVEAQRDLYSRATLALRTPLSFPMSYFPRMKDIPLIGRSGSSIRYRLLKHFNLPPRQRLVLVYLGIWGGKDVRPQVLTKRDDITFFSFHDAPDPIVSLHNDQWTFPDVLASMDAVVGKPGYGIASECMINAIPMIYYPRDEFAEYRVLSDGLQEWGGATCMSRDILIHGPWDDSLDWAFGATPEATNGDGARIAAEQIVSITRQPDL